MEYIVAYAHCALKGRKPSDWSVSNDDQSRLNKLRFVRKGRIIIIANCFAGEFLTAFRYKVTLAILNNIIAQLIPSFILSFEG